ncbi:MAG: toxin-antitoxin system, toxin component, PIN family protein [Planctomycetes bacterium]|nr:toxin-antitoxin system, toxin component, PIN family protein [Planctomycetota bacterium]
MRILLDACVWGGVRSDLEAAGHDVVWAGDWVEDPGDDEILARAYSEERILVTLDKDFGELAIVHKKPHVGIIRLVNLSVRSQAAVCLHIFSRYEGELKAGGIATAQPGAVRIRPPG